MSRQLLALTGGKKETASSTSGQTERALWQEGCCGPWVEHAERERKAKKGDGGEDS